MKDKNRITLSFNEKEILDYLNGRLDNHTSKEFEEKFDTKKFDSDAKEGFAYFTSKERARKKIKELDNFLHRRLINKKKHSFSRNNIYTKSIFLPIFIVLIICFVVYYILILQKK